MLMLPVGLLLGFFFLTLTSTLRKRQMMKRLGEAIVVGEGRLAKMKSSTPEAQALRERIDLLRLAKEGRAPMQPEQRAKVIYSLVPSVAVIVVLVVIGMQGEQTSTTYLLVGLGVGVMAAQVLNRVNVLRWRPQQEGDAVA